MKTLTNLFKSFRNDYMIWFVLTITVIFITTIRLRMLTIPLDRDEGTYAYIAQLLLQGVPPYAEAYEIKFPGIFCIYALIMSLFGQTTSGIHMGLLFVNIITILLIFSIGKRLFSKWVGVISSICYAILTLSSSIEGFSASAEHFMILGIMSGVFLILYAVDSDQLLLYFLSGILFGLAIVIKQNAIFFSLGMGGYLIFIFSKKNYFSYKYLVERFGLFMIGVIIPFCLTCIVFICFGIFDKFWFYTIIYTRRYISMVPLTGGLGNFITTIFYVIRPNYIFWIAGLFGLVCFFRYKEIQSRMSFIVWFLIASVVSSFPGPYFRTHYLILLFPAVSFFAGVGICNVYRIFSKIKYHLLRVVISIIFSIIILAFPLIKEWDYIFCMTPNQASRRVYGHNPFPESTEIAHYIRQNTNENDRIVVIGSEPQIYFYSKRRSATKYIFLAHLFVHTNRFAKLFQEEMIEQVKTNRPKYIIFVNIATSLLFGPKSEKLIVNWLNGYIEKYYGLVGVIDILPNKTVYKWNVKSVRYSPRSSCYLLIFRRET